MPEEIEIKLHPHEAADSAAIKQSASIQLSVDEHDIEAIRIIRKSLDARKQPFFLLRLKVFLKGEIQDDDRRQFQPQKVSNDKTCHIIGFGPAGIFAALQCLEKGIKPIVIERGKAVDERLKDISAIHKKGLLNPESNYCFGEGGAGTYSDGKLYTRSSKRGDIKKVLDTFIQHGADEKIGFEAHPHIGTNKLPRIIQSIRQFIIANGGEIHFNTKLVDVEMDESKIAKLKLSNGATLKCQNLVLATGHSSRDIFQLLDAKKILIETKPFALGVRIEHPQAMIDSIQYKCSERGKFLPPSSYSLVAQANGRGVFSFCMCPGGVIAPAATAPDEIVVNGWSSSARNGPFSNSGLVVEVKPENWKKHNSKNALAALFLQAEIEQNAFQFTKSLVAPAQRVEDFIQNRASSNLPRTSYSPGIFPVELCAFLPEFITKTLREGLIDFGKKMKGYRTNEAVLIGVESRTSSPVRIPRDRNTLRHPQITNLFPCGEGAGYAGGIVSAAMDGMACANAID